MQKEGLTDEELLSVLHKQSFDSYEDVRRCVLEPNGTFFIEGKSLSSDDEQRLALIEAVRKLTDDLQELRAELKARDAQG